MPQRIQAPDGSIVEFPDGMNDGQIASVMRREYGGPDTRKASQSLGFMKGVAKPLSVGEKVNPLNLFDPGGYGERSNAQRDASMNSYFAKREETQRPGVVGEIAGNIVGTIPATLATRNPFVAGGLQGAMLSDAKTPMGLAGDVAMGAGLNWAGGKVMDAVGDVIRPVIAPSVRRLNQAGVKLTPGMVRGGKAMVREDKRMSKPVVGDVIAAGRQKTIETFNTATANRALAPIGVRIPARVQPGNDTIAFAKKTLRDAYDDVVPKMAVRLDGKAFVTKLAPSAANLEGPQRKQLTALISQHLKNGQLSGQALKDAHGELRRLASSYGRDQSAANRELGKVLGEASDDLMEAMLAQNPALAPRLAKVNEAYRGYKIAAGAAKGADEGIFTTGQLRQAVVRGDRSKDKDAAARGVAFMQDFSRDARKVIPAKAPNPSGTAAHVQAGNIFANIKGAGDALAYNVDEAFQRFRLAARPAGARKAARTVRRLKGPAGGAAVAASSQVSRE